MVVARNPTVPSLAIAEAIAASASSLPSHGVASRRTVDMLVHKAGENDLILPQGGDRFNSVALIADVSDLSPVKSDIRFDNALAFHVNVCAYKAFHVKNVLSVYLP